MLVIFKQSSVYMFPSNDSTVEIFRSFSLTIIMIDKKFLLDLLVELKTGLRFKINLSNRYNNVLSSLEIRRRSYSIIRKQKITPSIGHINTWSVFDNGKL